MNEEIITADKNGKKRAGSTQVVDTDFTTWLERQFRDDEHPTSIDAYPLWRGRDRETRCYHHDFKADETITTERVVEIANHIVSDCQITCDRLPLNTLGREGTKTFQVAVIDDRRGGLMEPVGTYLLKLGPRIHKPAPNDDDPETELDTEDSEALTSRKMMMQVFNEIAGRHERGQANTAVMVGEVLLLQKEHIKESFDMIRSMHNSQLTMMEKFQQMIEALGKRSVEEKAVAIDAANAEVERDFRRAQMQKENMWTTVMQAGMLEAVKVLGGLFPGFGQLFSALIQGKPIPPPPQLPPANGTPAAPAVSGGNGQPQLPPPAEKALIDRFIEAAEKQKIGDSTVGEKLFGKDDDAGKPVEPGVFTREQVAILTGVHMGTLGIDALDALLPESGKPEAVQPYQMMKAIAFLTPDMLSDITKVLEMRKVAKKGS